MAYYRGDYYRGDYYRGDLGGFLRKAGKAIGGAVTGFIGGGPLGAVSGALGGLRKPSNSSVIASQAGVVGGAIKIGARVLPPILAGKEVLDLAGGLFGRGGKQRRTMNHLNPKALSRATRRVEGFVKKARKAVSPLGYTIQRRGAGRAAPKKRCR